MISLVLFFGKLLDIYNNLNSKVKEIINYLIVGGCTTVISVISYFAFRTFIENYEICTVLSWICAVLFAYVTNRIFVFKSNEKNIVKEFSQFIFSRLLSLIAELACMFVFVDFLKISDKLSKIIVQFIIIVLNYIFSKLFVFKK